jgi:anti-sigma factor RsiW
MYQDDNGHRLTVYMTAFYQATAQASRRGTLFGNLRDGQRITFYWMTHGMAYAVSGHASDANLRGAALEICNALGGNPSAWQ